MLIDEMASLAREEDGDGLATKEVLDEAQQEKMQLEMETLLVQLEAQVLLGSASVGLGSVRSGEAVAAVRATV